MLIDINKYILPIETIDLVKVLSGWTWLIGENKNIVALTKAGDLLLKDDSNKLYFLDIGNGSLSVVSDNYQEFFSGNLSEEVMEEILFPSLVEKLESNFPLKPDQVYSYTLLPIIGGAYDEKNMFAVDLYEHYILAGNIHFQIKDSPDGTFIEIKVNA